MRAKMVECQASQTELLFLEIVEILAESFPDLTDRDIDVYLSGMARSRNQHPDDEFLGQGVFSMPVDLEKIRALREGIKQERAVSGTPKLPPLSEAGYPGGDAAQLSTGLCDTQDETDILQNLED